ncbi:Phosphoserine phosphatase RsbU [Roseimaritima multifibrata]|uniref:Phosphoserine phosphatase RsbU n=1 Tax=Roseimaritima multifibrata TaxID=1930274 RepID=A0A517MJ24_9BACT|nr:SpoIIE family protein phosphatase [Roseimaritima multifibrata]QDS94895.1 Phosphoserine phosphatase RsbU [Roseimaritima multifibrata]
MAFLSSRSEGTAGRYDLGDQAVIGRHPECDVLLTVGAVSRHHAKVYKEADQYFLEDLQSRNGTFVNGKLITSKESLSEGDRIRVCEVELVFHFDSPAPFVPSAEMTFDGTQFGILMVDDPAPSNDDSSSSRIDIRRSGDTHRLVASADAKLAALLKITRNLAQALSLDDVLPKVLSTLFEIFSQADRGFVVLREPDGSLAPRWVKTRGPQQDQTIRISRTIINEAMSAGEPILSLDAANDDRFDAAASIADFRIRSMICAPLIDSDGVAFGALQIDSSQGQGRFSENDIDLLAAVAAQAGIVIRNAQLHEQALLQREVEQDLKLSTEVQQAFLPQKSPTIAGYQLRSFYKAAHHIGGDYFDYIRLPGDRVGVVVADVTGHGVAAAMFMAKLSAETRFCLAGEPDVAKAIENLNDRMSALQVERFVTFLLMVIDPVQDSVSIVNAGHMPPIVRRAKDGQISEPGSDEAGLPIAIDAGFEYIDVPLQMEVGDLALMYTDGINEAMNSKDEQFGMDAVREIVAEGAGADATLQRLVSAVAAHVGNGPQDDDICVVIIERVEDEVSLPDHKTGGDLGTASDSGTDA